MVTMDPPQPPYHEYDILTVNNNGLLDLNSESHELVSHIDLGVEVEAVKRLLTPEFHKPMTHTSQQQAASLEETSKLSKEASSHQSPSRAREIMRENKQLLDRLERIITAKPDINVHNASIEEHDKVTTLNLRLLLDVRFCSPIFYYIVVIYIEAK